MQIIKSKMTAPRMIIYGEHKMGKSTFGSQLPKVVFIATEDGLGSLNVDMFPVCQTFKDVIDCLKHLITTDHDFKSVCVDSLDWLERLIFDAVKKELGWSEINPPKSFGRGYIKAEDYWKEFLSHIDVLHKRGMMICLLAHSKVKKFEDPERDNFDRWQLDLQDRGAGIISEYVDLIGFASEKVVTVSKKEEFGTESVKAKSTGERVLNLNRKASFEAGNRYGLPDQIPLSWSVLAQAIRNRRPVGGDLTEAAKSKSEADIAKAQAKQNSAA